MKKIIQLSDLHFGTEIKEIIPILLADVKQIHPDLIVISGDFTQRALTKEFKAAREFINSLNHENILCVPGNHDVTLYNPIRRFFKTYARYQEYISKELNPQYCDNELAVLGINSATPYKAKGGIVTAEQLRYMIDFFHRQPPQRVKILVMHHNLLRSERHKIIQNSEGIIDVLAECKVNIILGGHIHYSYIEEIKREKFHHSMYAITAGTAISDRLWRDEENSYNILEIGKNEFKLSIRVFDGKKFITEQDNLYPLLE